MERINPLLLFGALAVLISTVLLISDQITMFFVIVFVIVIVFYTFAAWSDEETPEKQKPRSCYKEYRGLYTLVTIEGGAGSAVVPANTPFFEEENGARLFAKTLEIQSELHYEPLLLYFDEETYQDMKQKKQIFLDPTTDLTYMEWYQNANLLSRTLSSEGFFNSKLWKETDEQEFVEHQKKIHEEHYAEHKSWFFSEINSKEDAMYRTLALGKAGNNEHSKAIEYCNKGLEVNPKSFYLFYLRGRTYGDMGEFKKGILDLSKAIKLQPNMADAHIERGFIYYKMEDFEKAKKDYLTAKKMEPDITLPLGWEDVLK